MAETIGLRAVIDVKQFNKGLGTYVKGIDQMNRKTSGFTATASRQFTSLGGGILKFGALAGGAALVGIGALGLGLGALGVSAVGTAISFESAFTGVTKTIDDLSDPLGQLTSLGQEIRTEFEELSTIIPATFQEIAAVGEIGGQLGIGAESITEFTETVIQLRDTTNLTAEEAATALARIGSIYQVTSDDIGQNTTQLGSTVVALGNEFATTESEILNFATRIAGAGQVVGLTQTDLLGIGAAFSSVGVQSEAGGSAVQTALLDINNAVNAGASGFTDYSDQIETNVDKMTKLNAESARLEAQFPGLQSEIRQQFIAFVEAGGAAEDFGRQLGDKVRQRAFEVASALGELQDETAAFRDLTGQPIDTGQLAKFAQVAGVSADEFKEAWATDAAGAFQLFIEGLGREGDNAASALDELGLGSRQTVRAFLSLAGAGDKLGDTLAVSNQRVEDGNFLADEAAKRYATTASKLKILKNTFQVISARIGGLFLPLFNQLIDSASEFITKWAGPIQDVINNTVIPAIDGIIKRAQELLGAFQVGGVAGLAAALGLTPETTELVSKIVGSITELGEAISSVLLPAFNQLAGGGLLDIINTAIGFVNENFEAFKGAIIGIGAVLAGAAIVAAIAAIGSAIAVLASPIGIIIVIAAALGAAWSTNFLGMRDTLTEFWFATVLPILSQLFQWLQVNIPIAIQSLATFWQTVLLPSIFAVWEFIQVSVFPLFVTLFGWLQIQLPLAIQFLTDTWLEIFLPAITLVWEFISESIIPLLTALAELINAVVSIAIEALAIIWETRLLPAITSAWSFFQGNIIPVLKEVAKVALEILKPAIEKGIKIFDDMVAAIKVIPDFINDIIKKIKELAEAIANIDLGFLKPGSPSPFEISLKGVDEAMKGLNRTMSVSVLFNPSTLPDLSASGASVAGGSVAGLQGANGGQTTNVDRSITIGDISSITQPQSAVRMVDDLSALLGAAQA